MSLGLERPVIDASVAVKWYLTAEIYADSANQLLQGDRRLLVPDLIFPEVANIVGKQVRKKEMTETEAVTVIESLGRLGLLVFPSQFLMASAVQIACRTDRTAYESLYLALAIQEKTMLVTADERLFTALQNTLYTPFLCWIENVP